MGPEDARAILGLRTAFGWTEEYVFASIGDANGDGRDDAAIGVPRFSGVQVLSGPIEGTLGLAEEPPPQMPSSDNQYLVSYIGDSSAGDSIVSHGTVGNNWFLAIGGTSYHEVDLISDLAPTVRLDNNETTFLPPEGHGGFFGAALLVGDFDADGLADLLIGSSGAVYFISNVVGRGSSRADSWIVGEREFDGFGSVLAGGTDLDGDGIDDAVIGAPGWNAGEDGALYLLRGNPSFPTVSSAAELLKVSGSPGSELGTSLAVVDDMDKDGIPEIVAGAPMASTGELSGGAVYIFSRPLIENIRADEADVILRGMTHGGRAGEVVAAPGDIDGNGIPDLVMSEPRASPEGLQWESGNRETGNGIVHIFLDPPRDGPLSQSEVRIVGDPYTLLGQDLGGAGDLNGDGYSDLLISAPYAEHPMFMNSTVYLFYGGRFNR